MDQYQLLKDKKKRIIYDANVLKTLLFVGFAGIKKKRPANVIGAKKYPFVF
jgi:hypothetical protein